MENEESSRPWRVAAIALALVLLLSVVAEALIPAAVSAQKRDRDSVSASVRQAQLEKFQEGLRNPSRRVDSEIVGGKPVAQGRFPFLAFVQIEVEPELFASCGGSLIDALFVLTAAHCVTDEFGTVESAENVLLAVGQVSLNNLRDGNIRGVDFVNVHPGYDPDTFENDVAVLQLDEFVPANLAQPLSFVGSGDTVFDQPGQLSTVAGWGAIFSGGPTSDRLLATDVNVISDSSCEADYQGSGDEIFPDVMICAAFQGRDSCQGDSGGPLMAKELTGFKIKKKKGGKHKKPKKKKIPIFSYTQTGIVSFGIGCAHPDFPGVYTQVSAPGINDFIVDAITT